VPQQPFLVPWPSPGCKAKLGPGNVKHFKKVHGIERPTTIGTTEQTTPSVTPKIDDSSSKAVGQMWSSKCAPTNSE